MIRRVVAAGCHAAGDGYPNGAGTLRILAETLGVEIVDAGIASRARPWQLGRGGVSRLLALLSTVAGTARSLVHALEVANGAPLYVRHPPQIFMAMVAALPRRWRPVCIVEGYLSAWDVLRDRRVGNGLVRELVRRFERWALGAAALVLVDTEANRRLFVDAIGLAADRVKSVPLAIDESVIDDAALGGCVPPPEAAARTRPRRVVFLGTFVPLHGVARLAALAEAIAADGQCEVVIAGDGQDAPLLERFLADRPDIAVTWIRRWLSAPEAAALVASADLCLGVFGGAEKAARVLPFKVYLYLACGKPVVTQPGLSTPDGAPEPPIVAADEVAATVEKMRALLADPDALAARGAECRAYYRAYLSNAAVARSWARILALPLRA